LEGEIIFDNSTPSRDEIQGNISKALGKGKDLIHVEKIKTAYGAKKASILSYVYDDKEMIGKLKKEGKKAKKKKEENKEASDEGEKAIISELKEKKAESTEKKEADGKKEKDS